MNLLPLYTVSPISPSQLRPYHIPQQNSNTSLYFPKWLHVTRQYDFPSFLGQNYHRAVKYQLQTNEYEQKSNFCYPVVTRKQASIAVH